MEKNRKDIENEILNEERMGEEEDYEEYARLREEREGIRSRKERIAQEEQRRQAMEYERIRIKEAQERQAREEQKKISSILPSLLLMIRLLMIHTRKTRKSGFFSISGQPGRAP